MSTSVGFTARLSLATLVLLAGLASTGHCQFTIPSGSFGVIAGNGSNGGSVSYNGSAATSIPFAGPVNMAVNSSTGDIYIGDFYSGYQPDNVIWKALASTGHITTIFAGDYGYGGYTVDGLTGGLAAGSLMNGSGPMVVDSTGALIFADQGCLLRKVDSSGYYSTIAGTLASCGTNYGIPGPATSAGFNIFAIAIDSSDNIYISEADYILKLTHSTGVLSIVAGVGGGTSWSGDGGAATSAGIEAEDIAVDSTGRIFMLDLADSIVRMVDTSGNIHTVAGGSQYFDDDTGEQYVVECNQLESGDENVATSTCLTGPTAIATYGSKVYIAEPYMIQAVDGTGYLQTIVGPSGIDTDWVTTAPWGTAQSLKFDSSGHMYVTDLNDFVIYAGGGLTI